jgi:hypothetical protein
MGGPGSTRDPVSIPFDASARRLLERAYAHRGEWQEMWLPDPSVRQRTRYLGQGINVGGPDPLPKGGGLDAKTRWGRGFARSVYFQHKWYSPTRQSSGWRADRRTAPRNTGGLRMQFGRHVPASPQFDPAHPERGGFPPRRRVRVQMAAGGRAKDAAVARMPDADRSFTGPKGSREPGPRWGGANRYKDWA